MSYFLTVQLSAAVFTLFFSLVLPVSCLFTQENRMTLALLEQTCTYMSLIGPDKQVCSVSHGSAFLGEEVRGWCMAGNLTFTLNPRTLCISPTPVPCKKKRGTYWRRTYNPFIWTYKTFKLQFNFLKWFSEMKECRKY